MGFESESGTLKSSAQLAMEKASEPKQEESSELKSLVELAMEKVGEPKKEAPAELKSASEIAMEKVKRMDLDINSQTSDADKIAEIGKKMGLNVSKSVEEKQAKINELKLTRGKIEISDNPERTLKTAQEVAMEKVGLTGEKQPESTPLKTAAEIAMEKADKIVEKGKQEDAKEEITETPEEIVMEEKPKEIIADSENIEKTTVCMECGKESPLGSKFCGQCGKKFEGVKKTERMEIKAMPEDRFSKANSFEELYNEIKTEKEIIGSKGAYKPDHQIKIINLVRSGELGLDYVTRTGGLRDKVEELVNKEKNEKFINSLDQLLDKMPVKTPLMNTFKKFASFLTKERHFGGSKKRQETSPIQDMEDFVKEEKAEASREDSLVIPESKSNEAIMDSENSTEPEERNNIINIEDLRKKKKAQKEFKMTGKNQKKI